MSSLRTHDYNQTIYKSKLAFLEDLVLSGLKDPEYYDSFIKNKNLLEKRKFLSLLLLISTNMTLVELIDLKVKDFMKLIDNLNTHLNNYKELKNFYKDQNDKYYLNLQVDSYGKNLNLNLAFKEFFNEDLYKDIIDNKENMDSR